MKKKTSDILSEYLKTSTIAKKIDVSTATIRREIKSGKLKAFEFHGEFIIKREDFEEWKARYFNPFVAS